MKKLFISAVLVAAMAAGMTSCDKGAQCWEITFGGVTVNYYYGTSSDADAFIKDTYFTSFGYTKSKSDKSEADCKGGLLDF